MLPDLRLLIPATVATFFLAAALGLFASLRIAQEPPFPRADQLSAGEETPIARISASWPLPEPGRAAALRDLTRVTRPEPEPVAEAPVPAPAAALPQAEKPAAPTEPKAEPAPAVKQATAPSPIASDAPAREPEAPAPAPAGSMTEGQRLASRPEPAERAESDETPAKAAPAEIAKPKLAKPRHVKKRTPRYARRDGGDPFSGLPRPGFEGPNTFSIYGRHNLPR